MKNYTRIQVQCNLQGLPVQLEYGRSSLWVRKIMEIWKDTGCWWQAESEKAFYRLLCHDNSIREVFLDLGSGEWFLYKTYD